MLIRHADIDDISLIHSLAHEIWWPVYSGILPDEQISFMLEDIYSERSLETQFKEGKEFLIAERDDRAIGFAGYSGDGGSVKIHKLYILPSEQGKGTGRRMLEYLADLAIRQEATALELNVNRGNPALEFYRRSGFEIVKTVDIPYHKFVLNDYVMRKEL